MAGTARKPSGSSRPHHGSPRPARGSLPHKLPGARPMPQQPPLAAAAAIGRTAGGRPAATGGPIPAIPSRPTRTPAPLHPSRTSPISSPVLPHSLARTTAVLRRSARSRSGRPATLRPGPASLWPAAALRRTYRLWRSRRHLADNLLTAHPARRPYPAGPDGPSRSRLSRRPAGTPRTRLSRRSSGHLRDPVTQAVLPAAANGKKKLFIILGIVVLGLALLGLHADPVDQFHHLEPEQCRPQHANRHAITNVAGRRAQQRLRAIRAQTLWCRLLHPWTGFRTTACVTSGSIRTGRCGAVQQPALGPAGWHVLLRRR